MSALDGIYYVWDLNTDDGSNLKFNFRFSWNYKHTIIALQIRRVYCGFSEFVKNENRFAGFVCSFIFTQCLPKESSLNSQDYDDCGGFKNVFEDVSKSFRTGRLERELQIIQLPTTRCSYIAILWVSLVSFTAITFCVAFQRVLIVVRVYFVVTQSGNIWIHRHTNFRALGWI
jgi:hypothetical protein